jgi:hypothetical protein
MTQFIKTCGNGGDYEFYQELAYWAIWIQQNIPGCMFKENFDIYPHINNSDKCIIKFDDDNDALVFSIKCESDVIRWADIDWSDPGFAISPIFS